jgi:hypothetical protein
MHWLLLPSLENGRRREGHWDHGPAEFGLGRWKRAFEERPGVHRLVLRTAYLAELVGAAGWIGGLRAASAGPHQQIVRPIINSHFRVP